MGSEGYKMNKKMRSVCLLLVTAVIWGFAFVAQSTGMDHVGPYTFMCCRFLLAGIALIPVSKILDRQKSQEEVKSGKQGLLKAGIICGTALFLGCVFQQVGIQYTTVGKAGFITTLYIVIVPVFGLFMHNKSSKNVWISVVLSIFGLYLLCMDEAFTLSKGDILELIGAFAFAAQILVVDRVIGHLDGVKLSYVQYFVCCFFSFILMLIFETPSIETIKGALLPILYAGLCSNAIGNTFQVVAQKDLDPTVASLLMSLESVFSVIAGWLLLNQALSLKEGLGCLLMLIAIILAQLPEKK